MGSRSVLAVPQMPDGASLFPQRHHPNTPLMAFCLTSGSR